MNFVHTKISWIQWDIGIKMEHYSYGWLFVIINLGSQIPTISAGGNVMYMKFYNVPQSEDTLLENALAIVAY